MSDRLGTAFGIVANFAVRVLVRLRSQTWLTPAISLRILRLACTPSLAVTAAGIRTHQPAGGWTTRTDLSYGDGGRDSLFDLAVPDGPGPHPVVVWTHGGGWHFGSKADPLPYLELLAAHGIAGVALNYPLAPRSAYPAAPRAVHQALAHLVANAADYGLDPDRVVLAGDSAGAQLAAEVAVSITSPAFAAQASQTPGLRADQLRGVLLFCGIYDTRAVDDSDPYFENALESAMWSLARDRHWQDSETCRLTSVVDHVTAAYPPTFLASGKVDPLTRRQTPPMAARLRELGVAVDDLEAGTDQAPAGHGFQYLLDSDAAREALERAVTFLEKATAP